MTAKEVWVACVLRIRDGVTTLGPYEIEDGPQAKVTLVNDNERYELNWLWKSGKADGYPPTDQNTYYAWSPQPSPEVLIKLKLYL